MVLAVTLAIPLFINGRKYGHQLSYSLMSSSVAMVNTAADK